MANYIKPEEYNTEMVACVKSGELSTKMIDMFTIHAKNVCRRFYIPDDDDKADAVSNCLRDFCLYWKNFSINNNCNLKFKDNLKVGDTIIINIMDYAGYLNDINNNKEPEWKVAHSISITIGTSYDYDNNIVVLRDTINKTLRNVVNHLNEKYCDIIKVSTHSSNSKLQIIDIYNGDLDKYESYSQVLVKFIDDRPDMIIEDKYLTVLGHYHYEFRPPSKAFLFLTSLCNNSIIKSLSQTSPAPLRNKKRVRINGINQHNNGFYNI